MSELQAVAFTLENYLTGSAGGKDEAQSRLVRISRVLSKQGMQGELAWQLTQVLRKCVGRREGLEEVVRRWLGLVDAILDMDWKKNKLAFYREPISKIIVESYTLIFSLIFEYRAHELIIDLKKQRAVWKPYLPYHTLQQIKNIVFQKHRLDLDKAFSASQLSAIRTTLVSRGFSAEQIERFLSGGDRDKSSERVERGRVEAERGYSSDEDEQDNRRKVVKQEQQRVYLSEREVVYRQGQQMSSSGMYHQYNGYQVRRPQQALRPGMAYFQPPPPPPMPQGQHFHPNYPQPSPASQPPSHNYPQRLLPGYQPPIQGGQQPTNRGFLQSRYGQPPPPPPPQNRPPTIIPTHLPPQTMAYRPTHNATAPIPAHPGYPPQQQHHTPSPHIRQSPSPSPIRKSSRSIERQTTTPTPPTPTYLPPASVMEPSQQTHRKVLQLIDRLRQGMHECKQCGMLFQFRHNLEDHHEQHFQEAQRLHQLKEAANKDPKRMADESNFMVDGSSWALDPSQRVSKQRQISLLSLSDSERHAPAFYCWCCGGELELGWSQQLQGWCLLDAVKLKARMGSGVCHMGCYEVFNQEKSKPQ